MLKSKIFLLPNKFLKSSIYSRHISTKNNCFYFTTQKFTDLPLVPQLIQCLQKKGFEHLTSIQSLALPLLLQGHNALLHGEASSGKTLCYVLPILNHILSASSSDSSKPNLKGAIVLAPTKELCAQIYAVFRMFDPENKIRLTRLGALSSLVPMIPHLEKGGNEGLLKEVSFQNLVNTVTWSELDILVTTPGQLEDILQVKDKKNPFDVNPRFLVLDEYDLILGEESLTKPARNILRRFGGIHKSAFGEINAERQFIVCGATPAPKIGTHTVEEELQNTFRGLEIVKSEGFQKIPNNVKYEYIPIKKGTSLDQELSLLHEILRKSAANKIIVFLNQAEKARHVFHYLNDNAPQECLLLVSNLQIEQRIRTILEFSHGQPRILVTTDLGSRGIDFKGVEHVIQFDFGTSPSTVLHRAGRTGRCGSHGTITSFVREKEEPLAERLKNVVEHGESFDVLYRKNAYKK